MRGLVAQIKVELLLTLRRGESLLVTIAIPSGLLLLFSLVPITTNTKHSPALLLAGTLGIAVMATAMVSLGIATGYERHYMVLKRLGGTPLGRPRLIAAKIVALLAVEILQVIILITIASFVLNAQTAIGVGRLGLSMLLGTAAFSGIGLMMAGTLRAEANLTAANAAFLLLLVLGGSIVPMTRLPHVIRLTARKLPAAPLTEAMKWAVLGGKAPLDSLVVLASWAAVTLAITAFTFAWE